jgi:Protein of unknown function (DUF2950)
MGEMPMRTLRVVLAFAALGFAATSSAAAPKAPKTFATPREAGEALVAAAAGDDVPALLAIFGSQGAKLVESGDEVQDRNDRARFAEIAREKLDVSTDPKRAHRAMLVVGSEAWPFPVPLVEKKKRWAFASKEGLHELLARRIGSNELDAIEICRGYVEAQQEYAEQDRDGDGVLEYAQKVISSPGKRDGLVWREPDGALAGPIAQGIAAAISEGYSDKARPYHGYHFRILKRQGRAAHLGAMDYVINGKMIGGFALVAWPAEYGGSGVATFIVNHDGVVYEKDLGRDTSKIVSRMDRYDPEKTWRVVP